MKDEASPFYQWLGLDVQVIKPGPRQVGSNGNGKLHCVAKSA